MSLEELKNRELKKKDEEIERLRSALEIATKALKYCSVEPGMLRPENNRQNAVAMNALAAIDEVLEK